MSSLKEGKNEDYILQVKNLQTHFHNESGVVKAVDDISFNLRRGETIGIVGESGSGKSVTSLSIMRLIPNPPGFIAGGEILFNSSTKGTLNLTTLPEKAMHGIRGDDISMIFQEPMTSLNPVYTCGNQVMETILIHRNISKKEAYKQTIELLIK